MPTRGAALLPSCTLRQRRQRAVAALAPRSHMCAHVRRGRFLCTACAGQLERFRARAMQFLYSSPLMMS